MSDGRSLASAVRSVEIVLDGIKTRASVVSWDQSGRYPLTAQVVSGVQAA